MEERGVVSLLSGSNTSIDLSSELDEGILAVFFPNWSLVLVGLLVIEERGVVSLLQSKARSFVKGGVPESVFTRAPIGPGEAFESKDESMSPGLAAENMVVADVSRLSSSGLDSTLKASFLGFPDNLQGEGERVELLKLFAKSDIGLISIPIVPPSCNLNLSERLRLASIKDGESSDSRSCGAFARLFLRAIRASTDLKDLETS